MLIELEWAVKRGRHDVRMFQTVQTRPAQEIIEAAVDGQRRRTTDRVVQSIRVGPGPVVLRRAFGDLWLTHLRGALWRLRIG